MVDIRRRGAQLFIAALITLSAFAAIIALITLPCFDARPRDRFANVPMEGSFIEIDGVRVHYVSRGTGDPLVLIHGFGAWSYSWRRNIGPLSKDFKVYALDMKGFGLSDKPANSNYSLEAQAKLVASFMDELEIEKAVVVGNSLGGEVALKLYSMRPERIRGLVLIDSTGYFEGPTGPLVAPHPKWFRLAVIRSLILTRWQVRRQLHLVYSSPRKITEDVIDGYYLPLKADGMDEAVLAMWDTLRLENEIPIIRTIGIPTLIIWGQNDRIVPLSFARRFKTDIPRAELVIAENAGHAPQEESPQTVNEAIKRFALSLNP